MSVGRMERRGYVFPAGQFDEHGLGRSDLEPLVEPFDNNYELWDWLMTPDIALDGAERLALVNVRILSLVEAAATGYLQGDFS